MSFKYRTKDDDMRELHFKLPKALMYEKKYKKLSANAKLLYAMLNDRTNLSMKNNWYDKFNRAFIICSIEEIEVFLDCARGSANKYLKELVNFNLVKKAKASEMEIGQVKNNTMDVENLKDSNSNILYVGYVDTSNETLEKHLDNHFENLKQLKQKRKKERKEREQRALFKNCTILENTNIESNQVVEPSNCKDSTKNELTIVQNLHGSKTDFSKTDFSMYVCSDESQNKTILDLYKNKIGEVSLIAEKELKLLESKLDLDLCDFIFIKAKNNKRINDLEKYIISKLKRLSEKNIKTISEYEADVKSYSEKTYNKKGSSDNNSNKDSNATVPKVKTRFHNISQRYAKYDPDELELLLKESQQDKFENKDNTQEVDMNEIRERAIDILQERINADNSGLFKRTVRLELNNFENEINEICNELLNQSF